MVRFEIWDDNTLEQVQPLIKIFALNSQVCGNGYSNIYGPQKLLQRLCSHRTVELGDNGGSKVATPEPLHLRKVRALNSQV